MVTPPTVLLKFSLERGLPWIGIDIGGTLTKVAYFEYHENGRNGNHVEHSHSIVQDLVKSHQYGSHGERDARLELRNVQLGTRRGNLHFIRFPTCKMDAFFEIAQKVRAKEFSRKKFYATGGGAFKFERQFKEVSYAMFFGEMTLTAFSALYAYFVAIVIEMKLAASAKSPKHQQ